MSPTAALDFFGAGTEPVTGPKDRIKALFEELSELAGQRNAIAGRIVEIIAEIAGDRLWGATGARSVSALVAWRLGVSSATARAIAGVAHRLEEFPRCAAGMREGRPSLDQVGVIAARAGEGSDAHYAELARYATVSRSRTALSLEPRPDLDPLPPARSRRSPAAARSDSCPGGSGWTTKRQRSSTPRWPPIVMR